MKAFMEEYGFAILAAVVALTLILMCTPIGDLVGGTARNIIQRFRHEEPEYTITLNANGGVFTDNNDSELYYLSCTKGEALKTNENCQLKTPYKKGYDFKGWYTTTNQREDTLAVTEDAVFSANKQLFAWWSRNNESLDDDNAGKGMHGGELWIENKNLGSFKQGTKFDWLGYNWIVLNISDNKALIASTNVYKKDSDIDGLSFGNATLNVGGKEVSNAYNKSTLASNIENLYSELSEGKSSIVNSSISIGMWGDEYAYMLENSTYHVFALSTQEVKEYLDSDEDRIASNLKGETQCWWTRSGATVITKQDNEDGTKTNLWSDTNKVYAISEQGKFINVNNTDKCGVRYAMYVNLLTIKNIKITEH